MALVVNTNVPSIASQRYLMESRKEMETAMERLSSGKESIRQVMMQQAWLSQRGWILRSQA